MLDREEIQETTTNHNRQQEASDRRQQETARDRRRKTTRQRWKWNHEKEPCRKCPQKIIRTTESYLCEKGPKIMPSSHRSMESPGKYSLYPQRPREECGPGLDMLRAIRPDRGVLICFRLTWTAAKIRS